MKTCEDCGTTYDEDECPFCKKEKEDKKRHDIVEDFMKLIDLYEKQ
jgi:recombinational DNA repair protein RecR